MSGSIRRRTSTIVAAGRIGAEHLAVRAPDSLAVAIDVHDVDPRADHVFESSTGSRQRPCDRRERAVSLLVGVPDSDDPALVADRRRAGDVDEPAVADRAGIPDATFPGPSRRDVLAHADPRGVMPPALASDRSGASITPRGM
jgi:hypothetical protein